VGHAWKAGDKATIDVLSSPFSNNSLVIIKDAEVGSVSIPISALSPTPKPIKQTIVLKKILLQLRQDLETTMRERNQTDIDTYVRMVHRLNSMDRILNE